MRDYEKLVKASLPNLWLGGKRQQEVISELACYLEDRAEDCGDAAPVAAVDWALLGSNIRDAKETLMDRMRQLVIPGTIALVISSLAQLLCYFLGLRSFVFPTAVTAYVFQWPWLAALPIAGATAAYLARRNSASPGRRALAAMFPALQLTPLMVVVGAIEILYRLFTGTLARFPWETVVGYVVSWTLVPAIPLMLGAAFFVAGKAESQPSPRMAHTA